jgi:transposase
MKRLRFTEEQIIGILREQEAAMSTPDVCHKHGISSPTFYCWKAKCGGIEVSDVSLELSRSTWLITSVSPGGEKMWRHGVAAIRAQAESV